MAAKKKVAPSKDHRAEQKKLRTQANAKRRAARHQRQLSKHQHPARGTARALRRWCDGVSREWPNVLNGRYELADLRRPVTPKSKERQPTSLLIRINGVPMYSPEAAAHRVRELMRQAREATARSS